MTTTSKVSAADQKKIEDLRRKIEALEVALAGIIAAEGAPKRKRKA